ncbi:MAG: MiaB/RimO family radical SAM methylthiotransferase, partial [Cyanobacteria bacterium REEB65]|nr:MiaB/RimO family radical SAM methylthiotransferase [Cyanobacteria bacterium REEB65]
MSTVATIAFATLGCKTNQAETVRLVSELGWDLAMVPFDSPADVYVINSCTVTHEADRQSRQLIRRAHRLNPAAAIVVTGCAVDYAASELAAMPGVRHVARNRQKDEISAVVGSWYTSRAKGPVRPIPPQSPWVNTRAWLKIAEGCDNHCSFCVIPQVRGGARSIPAEDLADRARSFAGAGFREIVLTGTNLSSYGQDGASGLASTAGGTARGSTLGPLVQYLQEAVPEVWRWRISSIEPIGFPDDLVGMWASERVCPHVHLCLQSGSDAVLARMRRRYSTEQYRTLIAQLREVRPDLALTTDVIVGFPGETAGDFDQTLSFLREVGFCGVHLFPYSDRAGTAAVTIADHVGASTISDRMAAAQAVVRELQHRFYESWRGR